MTIQYFLKLKECGVSYIKRIPLKNFITEKKKIWRIMMMVRVAMVLLVINVIRGMVTEGIQQGKQHYCGQRRRLQTNHNITQLKNDLQVRIFLI